LLAESESRLVAEGFGVYEHDWRYFSSFLGEPFLVGNLLAYFDGSFLYICCFPLGDVETEVSADELMHVASQQEFQAAGAVDVWGRFAAVDTLRLQSRRLPRIKYTDYAPSSFDVYIDLRTFDRQDVRGARLAWNAVRNRGVVGRATSLDYLDAEHVVLVEDWLRAHDISSVHASIVAGLTAEIRAQQAVVFEALADDGAIIGFAITTVCSRDVAVLHHLFSNNAKGSRAADCLLGTAIDFFQNQGIRRLHLGYSYTSSLLRFKRKWGAVNECPRYREAFYTDSSTLGGLIRVGQFLWASRVAGGVRGTPVSTAL